MRRCLASNALRDGLADNLRGVAHKRLLSLILSLDRARGASGIGTARKQALTLHHYAVRRDMGLSANIRAVEQHRGASHSGAAANHYAVNLENPIFKSMSLKLTAYGSSILELQHVGIDYLRETASQDHPPAYSDSHRSQVPRKQQGSF